MGLPRGPGVVRPVLAGCRRVGPTRGRCHSVGCCVGRGGMTWQAGPGETGSERGHDRRLVLRAVCFGCGLERTDDPLVEGKGLSACLACGETRMVIDDAPGRDWQARDALAWIHRVVA